MTVYKVYWTDCGTNEVLARMFEEDMVAALNLSNALRSEGHRFVSMVSENTDMVGSFGVSAVVNGKLPNGDDYTWKKRRV